MSYLNDVLLGIIEGITEFLPISSTGHLLLAEQFLGARSDAYNIVIQAGAILAVTLIYWRRLVGLVTGWNDPANRDYLLKLLTAFGITAVLGLVVKKLGFELPETVTPIAWALVIGGVWMLVAEHYAEKRGDLATVTWKVAVLVGLAQVVAGVFPGTSRSAAAIFIAMLAGTSRRSSATEFVFLVGIPTMFAASAFAFLELVRDDALGGEDWSAVAVAFSAAAVTGFAVVRWLMGYIKAHRFTVFAVYRIVLGALLLAFMPAGS